MVNNRKNIEASFRDPSGKVFLENGKVFRGISHGFKPQFETFINSGLYEDLTKDNLLVKHAEVQNAGNDFFKIILPDQIPFISYPYEWSFSQYKDAALLTLKIAKRALKFGMVLKDASAYNVQFLGSRPVFIDTLSFEKYKEGAPWIAYKQFCQHFLAPLAIASFRDIRLFSLMRDFIDGVPLDLAAKILPLKAKLKPSLFIHIVMHAKAQQKYAGEKLNKAEMSGNFNKKSFLTLLNSLESSVRSLKFKMPETEWGDYYEFTNYDEEAAKNKEKTIKSFLASIKPKSVWDMGANDGRYTRIALEAGAKTVAFDIDPVAIEKGYLKAKEKKENLLFLIQDLTNPSPGIGWANKERDSLSKRGPADAVFALALIHHLAISNNLPFEKIASFFSSLGKHLVIEFVPKEDSKVQTLLATREDIFPDYSESGFEAEFSKKFKILTKEKVINSKRTLYLMVRNGE
jgi:ribosomal protein L11 methylase PrmA